MPETTQRPENDVIAIVPPDTGAHEITLTDDSNPDVELPVACYLGERLTAEGIKSAEPMILYRFRPTPMQRGKIAIGEDLYLVMLMPNGRQPLPIELQVGPGTFQTKAPEPASGILGADGRPIEEARSLLWTPDQEEPRR